MTLSDGPQPASRQSSPKAGPLGPVRARRLLDGATVSVDMPRALEAQYGTCPRLRPTPPQALASNITGPDGQSSTQIQRLRAVACEAPSPTVNVRRPISSCRAPGRNRSRSCRHEPHAGARFSGHRGLEVDALHDRAALPSLVPIRGSEWRAGHAAHPWPAGAVPATRCCGRKTEWLYSLVGFRDSRARRFSSCRTFAGK